MVSAIHRYRRSAARAALLLFVLAAISPAPTAARAQEPTPSCYACYLVSDDGRVLFQRRAHDRLPNASTTKMVTALLVVEAAAPDERVVVSANAAATGGGGQDLSSGQRYSVESLLYALLLTSSNDAAVALAEHVANDEEAFVADMNSYVRNDLGLRDTRFTTAHGLDESGHYSSAADLATIAEALLEVPLLAEIVGTRSARIAGPGGTIAIENRNLLLGTYPGAIGVKTGYTSGAGNVLVSAARRNGRTLIGVAMRSEDAAADSRALLDFGWTKLARGILLRAGTAVGGVLVADGAMPVVAARTVRGPFDPARVTLTFKARMRTGERIAEGSVVGDIILSSGPRKVASVDAVISGPVPPREPGVAERLLTAVLGTFGGLAQAAGIDG